MPSHGPKIIGWLLDASVWTQATLQFCEFPLAHSKLVTIKTILEELSWYGASFRSKEVGNRLYIHFQLRFDVLAELRKLRPTGKPSQMFELFAISLFWLDQSMFDFFTIEQLTHYSRPFWVFSVGILLVGNFLLGFFVYVSFVRTFLFRFFIGLLLRTHV